jgi:N-acetylmuramic acid 6-phosphate etherase
LRGGIVLSPKSYLENQPEHLNSQKTYKSHELDKLSTIDILKVFNSEDYKVSSAVSNELENIQTVIDKIISKVKLGGRLIYIGAGTSGRLGVLDASECPPTFGCPEDMVIGIIAGSDLALKNSIEGAEDDLAQAVLDLKAINLNSNDSLIGITASGNTPYVLSAIEYANKIGALSIGLCCKGSNSSILDNKDITPDLTSTDEPINKTKSPKICKLANYNIMPDIGPEVITGSTRLKSGTACKMILNMISNSVMIKLGKIYKNEMIDCQPTNTKLKKRHIDILARIISVDRPKAKELLEKAEFNIKLAALCHSKGYSLDKAKQVLDKNNFNLRDALGYGE